jgi:hypothetical protein
MKNENIENKNKLNNPNNINYIHFENEYLKYQKKYPLEEVMILEILDMN